MAEEPKVSSSEPLSSPGSDSAFSPINPKSVISFHTGSDIVIKPSIKRQRGDKPQLALGREILQKKNEEKRKKKKELDEIQKKLSEVENENSDLRKKLLEDKLKEEEEQLEKLKNLKTTPKPPTPPTLEVEDETPIQKQPASQKNSTVKIPSKIVFC